MKTMNKFLIFAFIPFLSCQGQQTELKKTSDSTTIENAPTSEISNYYEIHKGNDQESISTGDVRNGSLKNAKLLPFEGNNFRYFDSTSYLSGRAFLNGKLLTALIDSYKICESKIPGRHFCTMECSNAEGGKISPHRTHQNGLSIDFMTPLKKNDQPYYGLDSLGAEHYLLDFDDDGKYKKDPEVKIDFETLANHLLILENESRKNGLKINKVIFKMELKDELFATESGKKLLVSGIYITKNLSPLINSLHDDHYHVDFEPLK